MRSPVVNLILLVMAAMLSAVLALVLWR